MGLVFTVINICNFTNNNVNFSKKETNYLRPALFFLVYLVVLFNKEKVVLIRLLDGIFGRKLYY